MNNEHHFVITVAMVMIIVFICSNADVWMLMHMETAASDMVLYCAIMYCKW